MLIFLIFKNDLKTYLFIRGKEPDALAVCRAHRGLPVGFLLLLYSFFLLLSPYLCFISFLYLDLYVLDDTLISLGSFMQTKHLYVVIHI